MAVTGSDEREVALLKAFNEKQRGRASRIAYNAGFWYALIGVVGMLVL